MKLRIFVLSFFIIFTIQLCGKEACKLTIQEQVFQNTKYMQIGHGTHAIICFHGLGDYAHKGYAQLFQHMEDVTIFVPEMPYSTTFLNNKSGIISMGGSADIQAAVSFLQHIVQLGYNKIGLYGFSCGGAVVVQLMGFLHNRCLYRNVQKQFNIDITQISKLRQSIRVCILDRPFINFEHTMGASIGSSVAHIVKRCMLEKKIGSWILKRNFPGNSVILDAPSIFDVADTIDHMPFLMYAAKQDNVVGYRGIVQLYNHLKNNGADVLILQTDGSHTSPIPPCEEKKIVNFVNKWLYL